MLQITTSLLLLTLLAQPAFPQAAQSANYQLDAFELVCEAGGNSSPAFAQFANISIGSSVAINSNNFSFELGFLPLVDPQPTNGPVVFGVTPDFSPVTGEASITVSGLNFNKYGVGGSLAVNVGNTPASGVTLVSDTVAKFAAPAAAPGYLDVTVTTSLGSDTLSGGLLYTAALSTYGIGTPGCTGVEGIGAGNLPKVGTRSFIITGTNTPPSSLGLGIVGDAADVAGSDPFFLGFLLHVDLFQSVFISAIDFYSDESGDAQAQAEIPNNPSIIGQTYFAQSIWYWPNCNSLPQGLSSSKGLSITILPNK
ncbi:MAG: IPT/TIG domain-containing protein [Planctomycetes bacterium]|nr:IPT/TIG domain-containing protein [Planctomycetota bacterium]